MAATAASSALLVPMRLGTSRSNAPYAHTRSKRMSLTSSLWINSVRLVVVSLLGVLDNERTLLVAEECGDRLDAAPPGGPALTCLNLYRCFPEPAQGICSRAHREHAGFNWSH